VLGQHRLLCGDATRAADVERLMSGARAVLMATDPPYLVDYDGGNHPQTWGNGGKRGKDPSRHWDAYTDPEHSLEFYRAFLAAALDEALIEAPALYQWFGAMRAPLVFAAWQAVGALPHQTLIWAKSRSILTHSHYMWDYEPCLYGWVKGRQPKRKPPADARAIWRIDSQIEDGAGHVHPTMKPLECFRRPIAYHSKPGELIYEPFAGSGTALIAAEQLGRVCYALELAPAFCDVVVERWQRLTGRKAVCHG
jgi:DNA modification methylase